MDINSMAGIVIGTVGGMVVGPIALATYKSFKFGQKALDGAKSIGGWFGKRAAERIKTIKDKGLRDQLAQDIKNAPNEFDAGFDEEFDKEYNK